MRSFFAVNNNLEVRFASAGGGVFSALARKAFQQKYFVAGAVWNEDFSVSHILTSDKKELERLRGVKPVDSKAHLLFPEINTRLESGEKVLFAGTPSQVESLLTFIDVNSPNLLTIAVGSGLVLDQDCWSLYLSRQVKEHQSPVKSVHFANKEISGKRFSVKLTFENGDVVYDAPVSYGEPSLHSTANHACEGLKADIELRAAKIDNSVPDGKLGATLIKCNTEEGELFFDDVLRKKLGIEDGAGKDLRTDSDLFHFTDKFQEPNSSSFCNIFEFIGKVFKYSRWNISTLCKNFYYNLFSRQVDASICKGHYLLFCPHCVVELSRNSKIQVAGRVFFGRSVYRKEQGLTKLLLQSGAMLNIRGNYSFGVGSDIQVLKGGEFIIAGGGDTNMNVEIVCGERIEFKENVYLGRNVCVRDTNGNHYLNRQGYHTSRPVVLGTHAWICDRSVVMPGVRIGAGGIVGANSYVVTNVPSYTMVSGNPAKVVDEEIFWKE